MRVRSEAECYFTLRTALRLILPELPARFGQMLSATNPPPPPARQYEHSLTVSREPEAKSLVLMPPEMAAFLDSNRLVSL